MAEIAPLTPLRYDLARLGTSEGQSAFANVVAPPYDVIDATQRAALAAQHPNNIVKLILPDGEGDTKYANASDLFTAWRTEGVLVRDDEPAFYRYEIESGQLIQPFDLVGNSTHDYWLVYPEARRNATKVRAFREWILPEIARTVGGG